MSLNFEFDFVYIVLSLLVLFGFAAYFVIRDFLDLIDYLRYIRQVKVEQKKYKKYQEDKKKLLDKRLEREREIKESLGLDYPEQGIEYDDGIIVGLAKPVGEWSERETLSPAKMEKFARVKAAIEKLGPEGAKNMYWRIMEGVARNTIGQDKGTGRGI